MDYCCVGRCGATIVATQYGDECDVQCECEYWMQCGAADYPESICQNCERGFEDENYF